MLKVQKLFVGLSNKPSNLRSNSYYNMYNAHILQIILTQTKTSSYFIKYCRTVYYKICYF